MTDDKETQEIDEKIEEKTEELEREFQTAVEAIRNSKPGKAVAISDNLKLLFYGLYKQSTEGDCNTSRPWAVQVVARAKWDAWNNLKGIEHEEAKRKYVALYNKHGGVPNR